MHIWMTEGGESQKRQLEKNSTFGGVLFTQIYILSISNFNFKKKKQKKQVKALLIYKNTIKEGT